MTPDDTTFADENDVHAESDIRREVASMLLDCRDTVTDDAAAVVPFSGQESLDAEYCRRVGYMLARLLEFAVREGKLDPRSQPVTDLYRVAVERGLSVERVFAFAYLIERTALDELALDEAIGATSEPWPVVAQMVRRASFGVLAAYTEHLQFEPTNADVVDRLTTLYTRPLFEAVLANEVEGAARFGYPISLILFDVDRLSTINEQHGYGVGDRILERLGILVRQYFRQHDWVARHAEDSIAVLLTRTDANDASDLAERVRRTVEERLGFRDHRSDEQVNVTVSAAVINIDVELGELIEPARLTAEAEAALDQAKRLGRNRVERSDRPSVPSQRRLPAL